MDITAALLRAVDAEVISISQCNAISACFTHHNGGGVTMDMSALTEDELDALDAVVLWFGDGWMGRA